MQKAISYIYNNTADLQLDIEDYIMKNTIRKPTIRISTSNINQYLCSTEIQMQLWLTEL